MNPSARVLLLLLPVRVTEVEDDQHHESYDGNHKVDHVVLIGRKPERGETNAPLLARGRPCRSDTRLRATVSGAGLPRPLRVTSQDVSSDPARFGVPAVATLTARKPDHAMCLGFDLAL
jgi:hypothetical protein